ncbi:MAG: PD40 domain-containing protein [Muribaculaceae bacterium]|nr:PD40 domain-containing protein [Muribaculaceae bacterium]
MKKVFISALLLCSGVFSYAQLNVASIEKVALPEGVTANKATISPDGSYVVFSRMEKPGLHRLDLGSNTLTTVSEKGTTFGLQISQDGSTVVFRENSFDKNHLRKTALKSMNVATGKETTIVKATRELQGFEVRGAQVMAMNNGKLTTKSLTGAATVSAPVASIKGGQLYVTVNGKTSNISPQGTDCQSYLWPSVSPDGTKVVYYLARRGCYVCDLDGSNPMYLGSIRAPRWFDDATVVGMNDYDDGENVTASKIVAVSIDGSKGQNLTNDASMAMYPSVSNDGKIAYTTPAGELYIININK